MSDNEPLGPPGGDGPGILGEDIDSLRLFIRRFCEWACVGGKSDERHPNYRWVTGNRDFGPGYSSCADLAHVALYCAGVRLPWVNTHLFTEGDLGKPGFDSVVNINRLTGDKPDALRLVPEPGSLFQCGDALIVGNDSKMGSDYHAMVVLEHDGRERLLVAEYGQPGGHIAEKRVFEQNGQLWLAGRVTNKQLRRWLPFHLVVMAAAGKGLLEPITYPPGVV